MKDLDSWEHEQYKEMKAEEVYAEANSLLSFLSHSIKVGDQANIDKALEQVEAFQNKTKKPEPKTKLYNHAFTVAFTVISKHEDPNDVQEHDVLEGLQGRVASLSDTDDGDNVLEACEPYDTYEIED
jgi:hypothetical protein